MDETTPKPKRLFWFVFGLIVGVALGLLGQRQVAPYLPLGQRPPEAATEGTVGSIDRRSGQLLMTLLTDEGATLVTFTERIEEIGMLIEQGDMVALGLRQYQPFATDPPVARVRKASQGEPPAEAPLPGVEPGIEAPVATPEAPERTAPPPALEPPPRATPSGPQPAPPPEPEDPTGPTDDELVPSVEAVEAVEPPASG